MIVESCKNGFKYSKLTSEEVIDISYGHCICDSCNGSVLSDARLIYVLNMVFCKSCFEEWESKAKFYKQDVQFENMIMKRYNK